MSTNLSEEEMRAALFGVVNVILKKTPCAHLAVLLRQYQKLGDKN